MSNIQKPYIIVLGNEKGGTGKSTVAMHIIAILMSNGYSVGSIDVDARQGTLTRYVENRQQRIKFTNEKLPLPDHFPIFRSTLENTKQAEEQDNINFTDTLKSLNTKDYIVIDTPGSDSYLSRLAHSYANTLVTPINDSFIDLDMLVRLDQESLSILRPSTYSEMVWDQKKQRIARNGESIDWIVVRNRLANIFSKNKHEIEKILRALSKRIGYRMIDGFGERVIFRELFVKGLTLMDMKESKITMTMSHVAAKQELLTLFNALNLPELKTQDHLNKTGT